MIRANPAESACFRVKIISSELEQMKKRKPNFESLEGFWDPIEKEEDIVKFDESFLKRIRELISNPLRIPPSIDFFNIDTNEFLAIRDYRGEKTSPIYPKYNCKIPIKCFKRPMFNEFWMSYRANFIEHGYSLEKSPFDSDPSPSPFILEYCCHRTNKSVLVRSGLEFEVEGQIGTYSILNPLSQQDLIDFLSVNFTYLKDLISSENEDYSQEKVHKIACMYTAVRYVALIQGYFGNDNPSHWEIVEEEIKEKISEEVIKEINSMKSDVLKLIIATTAQWWAADFSVGAEGQFPPLLKKMLLEPQTLRPIFKDFMSSEKEMQQLVHKATHLVDKRNVLKSLNMDNNEWTGEIPVGLPVIKKVDIDRLGNSEVSEVLERVPAGYSSYSNCHKVLEIMKKYKLAKFIFEKKEAKLVNLVVEEISKKPNYHHINSSYLNRNDSRFQKLKRYYKSQIRNIAVECGLFLVFTGCHKGLQKCTIFGNFMPTTFEGIVKICPNWLQVLYYFIDDKARIEKAKQLLDKDFDKDGENYPFSQSPKSVLMKQFALAFRIRNGYLYWKDENELLLPVCVVDRSQKRSEAEELDLKGFDKLFMKNENVSN